MFYSDKGTTVIKPEKRKGLGHCENWTMCALNHDTNDLYPASASATNLPAMVKVLRAGVSRA